MLDISQRLSILQKLIQRKCLQQACILSKDELKTIASREIVAGVKGKVSINSKTVCLWIGLKENFPLTLPVIMLQPATTLGTIPHLETDGYICYQDPEGILLNGNDPVGILVEAIDLGIDVLTKGVNGSNKWDFMNEFHAYWRQVCPISLDAFLPVDNTLRKIYAYKTNNRYILATDSIDRAHAYFNHHCKKLDSFTRHTALYIPLKVGTFLTPPTLEQLWSVRELQEIINKNVSAKNKEILQQYRIRKDRKEELVILAIPRPQDGKTLIGLKFQDIGDKHPLISGYSTTIPTPISIQRYDRDYLIPRGGASFDFNQIKVLVVGCGAVGGHIPALLVQAGIQDLTLVDPDRLEAENTYRHVMGKSQEQKYKTLAIKEEIENKYPYLKIITHQINIELAISQGDINLSDFDLTIFATGNQTIELYLNPLTYQQGKLTVFTWLEPYGLGGHSLLTHSRKPGCFQCLLYSNPDCEDYNHNRASFAAPNQSFTKNNLGCGSSYTEYGAIDAQKTAIQAVELALDGLREVETNNPLISWKGRDDRFTKAGFKTSSRYELSSDSLEEFKYRYINDQCPICGRKK